MGIGNTANTGMTAALSNMGVISNNVANANTYAFKRSTIDFADIYASGGADAAGLGVRVNGIAQDFTIGGLASTGLSTDFSIGNPNNFFVVKDSTNGNLTYTRYGHFVVDDSGYLTFGNSRLQGYAANNNEIVTGGNLIDLQVSTAPMAAKASTTIDMAETNLNANDPIITVPFSTTDPNSYNFQTPTVLYDSLGNPTPANIYYIKTADNSWDVQVAIDGTVVTTTAGNITFSDNGSFQSATGLTGLVYTPTNGAAVQTFGLNVNSMSQFALQDTNGNISQDGYTAGTLSSYTFDPTGKMTLVYSNNQTILGGQIALASFASNAGLQNVGNMSWEQTTASGTAILTQASNLSPGTLELSNVDLTQEMVNLVGAQQTFQANAQVEQVYSQIMQTITQL